MKIDNSILAKFQMIGTRIVSLNIKNDSLSSDIISHGKKNLEISHEIVSVELHESNLLIGAVQLHISVRVVFDKAKFSLKLVLEGGFSAPPEMGDEMFRRMLSLNGIASLYGIARAQILSITSQSFADGSLILPMIDVSRYSKDLAEKTSD